MEVTRGRLLARTGQLHKLPRHVTPASVTYAMAISQPIREGPSAAGVLVPREIKSADLSRARALHFRVIEAVEIKETL
jgi:hypothetical protein